MNWILTVLKYLGPLLLLLNVIHDYQLKHIAPDPKSPEHTKTSKRKFLILIIAGLLGLTGVVFEDIKKSKDDKERVRVEKENTEKLNKKVDALNANQENNSQEFQKILIALATNSPPSPAVRLAIAQAEAHFEANSSNIAELNLKSLVSEYEMKKTLVEADKALARQKALEEFKETSVPVFNYSITALHTMLSGIAQDSKEKVVLDFNGIPDSLTSNITHVGSVRMGTNSAWCFDCSVARYGEINPFTPTRLRITSAKNRLSLWIYVRMGRVFVDLKVDDQSTSPEQCLLKDFKGTVESKLKTLIAANAHKIARN